MKSQSNLTLKIILLTQAVCVFVYTIFAVQNEGFAFFPKFFEFIQSLKWIGQFSLDFSCYLLLSSLWIFWRNKFTPSSIIIGIACGILGIILFAPYVLYLLSKENGNLKVVLTGDR